MEITDINGHSIEVTDLNGALEQAEYFKDCSHIPPVPSDAQRQKYWTDIYEKLRKIKENQKDN